MLVQRKVTLRHKFAGTHLYTWVEKGTVKAKCLGKKPEFEPRPLDLEFSALTIFMYVTTPPPHVLCQPLDIAEQILEQ